LQWLPLLLTDRLAAERVECGGHSQDDVPAEIPPLQIITTAEAAAASQAGCFSTSFT
jgi:hypothetical protein